MEQRLIDSAVAYVKALFASNAGGHDAAHTLRVYRTAMLLAETEPECDTMVVALAALLQEKYDVSADVALADSQKLADSWKEQGVAE